MTKVSDSGSSCTQAQIHHICYAEAMVGGGQYVAPSPQPAETKPAPQYSTKCYQSRLGTQCYSTPMSYNAAFGEAFAKSFNNGMVANASRPKFSKPHYEACLAKHGYVLN